MKRSTTFVLATGLFAAFVSVVACSSSDTGAGVGPVNTPPSTTPGTDSGGPTTTATDGGTPGTDGSTQPLTCTGPTFDNTRIPGWPTVPQP